MCTNPDCIAMQRVVPLKKDEHRQVVIFTQADGVHCAWSVHLKCRCMFLSSLQVCLLIPISLACNTNYHHNYAVLQSSRNYYTGLPKYIQVGEHQFIELELAMHWMDLMRIQYVVLFLSISDISLVFTQCSVSATNCARLYNEAEARRDKPDHDWQFKSSVTTEEVWDAFTILALLDDHRRQNTRLCIPHGNLQSDRYTAAMLARNERIITHGQDELPHACYGCMRLFSMPDGTTHYTEVVVTDGVTVGRPCCGVPHCKNPLASTRHRFCSADPSHKCLETTCAVDGCPMPVVRDDKTGKLRKSCGDPLHLKMEDANAALSRSGKSKTQRMKTTKLNDALAAASFNDDSCADEEALPIQDVDEWYEHDTSTGSIHLEQASVTSSTRIIPEACPSKAEVPKLKAIFFQKRTNNEQLFIRPCGIISGRGTMYHHEAVSNVLVCCYCLRLYK